MASALLQCSVACVCLQLRDGTGAVQGMDCGAEQTVSLRALGTWRAAGLGLSEQDFHYRSGGEHTDQFFVSIQIKHLFSWRTKYITASDWLSTGLGCCPPAASWHLCNGLQTGKHEGRKNYSQLLNLKILVLVKPLLLEINVFPEVVGWSGRKEGWGDKNWFGTVRHSEGVWSPSTWSPWDWEGCSCGGEKSLFLLDLKSVFYSPDLYTNFQANIHFKLSNFMYTLSEIVLSILSMCTQSSQSEILICSCYV